MPLADARYLARVGVRPRRCRPGTGLGDRPAPSAEVDRPCPRIPVPGPRVPPARGRGPAGTNVGARRQGVMAYVIRNRPPWRGPRACASTALCGGGDLDAGVGDWR